MNAASLKSIAALPKKSFRITQPPLKERVSARAVMAPAKPKGPPARARFSDWLEKAPKKPWIHGPKIPDSAPTSDGEIEEVEEVDEGFQKAGEVRTQAVSFFREEIVPKLDEDSHKKIKEICQGRLGSLVIRRVKSITASSKGKYVYVLHSPESHREITQEEYDELDAQTKHSRVETFFKGTYSFVTSKKPALPTHDAFEGEAIFANHLGRSEFDPTTLRLEISGDTKPMPRPSNNLHPDKDEPASLVCGVVAKNKHTKKLEFTRWAIISVQEQRAILSILEPDVSHPIRKGEVRMDESSYRSWLMGGGRLSTNAFRRRVLSATTEGGKAISAKKQERLYTRYVGSSWGLHHCHILSFWVLMCRYGELPCKGNIPSVIPSIKPKDTEKLKFYHEDKPLTWWDLPYLKTSSSKKGKKLDQYIIDKYELKVNKQKVNIPVHPRSVWAKKMIDEPPLEEQPGQNDIAELVLSRPVTPAPRAEESDSEDMGSSSDIVGSLDSGLSSDSETPRSESPSSEIEVEVSVFKPPDWATMAEEGEEMDFSSPLSFSSG